VGRFFVLCSERGWCLHWNLWIRNNGALLRGWEAAGITLFIGGPPGQCVIMPRFLESKAPRVNETKQNKRKLNTIEQEPSPPPIPGY